VNKTKKEPCMLKADITKSTTYIIIINSPLVHFDNFLARGIIYFHGKDCNCPINGHARRVKSKI